MRRLGLQHQVATLRGSSLWHFAASPISLTTKERNSFESSTKDSKELELGVPGIPFVIVRDSDLWDAKHTSWRRSEKYLLNHWRKVLEIPSDPSLAKRMECFMHQKLSKRLTVTFQ